MNKQSIEAALS